MMVAIDQFTSEVLSGREECDAGTPFMTWAARHSRIDLMGRLKATIEPGERIALAELKRRTEQSPIIYYEGADLGLVKQHASDESPGTDTCARKSPAPMRADVHQEQRAHRSDLRHADGNHEDIAGEATISQAALSFRLETILDTDYFVKAEVGFGSITHGLPILAEKEIDCIRVTLDPNGQSVRMLLDLYERDFSVFGGLAKDFVRNIVFPRIRELRAKQHAPRGRSFSGGDTKDT